MKQIKHMILLCLFCLTGMAAQAQGPADNEIWYTATSAVTPTNILGTNGADLTVTGNDYDESAGCWKITFSGDVITIGESAFQSCSALSSITIPASVTSIGKKAFNSCYDSIKKTGLTEVTFAEGSQLATIGESAFDGRKVLSSITIPASVTSIGKNAFNSCYDSSKKTGLTEVTFAEGSKLKAIGENAFRSCSALSSITIPASVTSIGKNAFYGCTKLETVTFAEGSKLEAIEESAFNGCKVLSSITIPASVTSIGKNAFQSCIALESINIPASVTSFGQTPFNGCTGLEAISVDAGNPVFSSPDGCNAIIETAKNTLIQGCKNTVIPESVKIIGMYAFLNMATLESIDIPASVTSISGYAFQFCDKLKSVTIPASSVLESLGSNVFDSCKALESINIPASVTSLVDYTFNKCSSLKSVTVNWAEAEKIVPINPSRDFNKVPEGWTLIVPAGTESLYAAATGWSSYAENMKVYIPVTLRRGLDSRDNYIGYFATFYSSESAYDLTGTNTKAYTGVLEDKEDEYEVKVLKLKDAGNIIGQGMGVVLKYAGEDQGSETIDIVLMPSKETATAGENILTGTDVELSWEGLPANTYALSSSKVYGVGFYYCKYEGWTIAAHKAYLTLSDSPAKSIIFQFEDEPTGIESLTPALSEGEGAVYNLNGMRVDDNYKGVVIKNGKKFYQK